MNLQEKEALFAAYIEGELTPDQQATFNALCESDNEFAERINNSNTFDRYAAEFSAPTPPRWAQGPLTRPILSCSRCTT